MGSRASSGSFFTKAILAWDQAPQWREIKAGKGEKNSLSSPPLDSLRMPIVFSLFHFLSYFFPGPRLLKATRKTGTPDVKLPTVSLSLALPIKRIKPWILDQKD